MGPQQERDDQHHTDPGGQHQRRHKPVPRRDDNFRRIGCQQLEPLIVRRVGTVLEGHAGGLYQIAFLVLRGVQRRLIPNAGKKYPVGRCRAGDQSEAAGGGVADLRHPSFGMDQAP